MKKFFKWLGMFFGVIVLLIAGLVINVTWFKPVSINIFFETAFLKYALESPEMLSSIRMLEQILREILVLAAIFQVQGMC